MGPDGVDRVKESMEVGVDELVDLGLLLDLTNGQAEFAQVFGGCGVGSRAPIL